MVHTGQARGLTRYRKLTALPDDQVLLQTLKVKDHGGEIPILKALAFRRGYQASLLFLGPSPMKLNVQVARYRPARSGLGSSTENSLMQRTPLVDVVLGINQAEMRQAR